MTALPSVLMFCPQFRPLVGGAERQAEKLSRALVRQGLRVTVLTPRLDEASPDHEDDCGVQIHRFRLFDVCKRLPWVRGLGPANLVSLRRQTIKAVAKHIEGHDVLHAHIASPLSAFAIEAAQRAGLPTLCKVAVAGLKTDLGELANIGFGGPLLAKILVQRLDRWVATTDAVRSSLLAAGVPPERIVTIPNGVEVPIRSGRQIKGGLAKRFLYLGRLSTTANRDVATLVRAFDQLADQIPDAELALVGDGDLYSETASLVANCRNRSRIQMAGNQQPEVWLDWADCFVLPSRYEGLSNALLEAMSHGLPCIANDIPPNREVLNSAAAGILVPVGDQERLFDEIHRLATVAGASSKIGDAAYRRVCDHYSIQSVAEKYHRFYQILAGQREKRRLA